MPATWPESLPRFFTTDSYQRAMGDGRLHSDTDTGPGKTRRRFSAVVDPSGGVMVMTDEQRQTLTAFVRDTLSGGSLPFNFPSQEVCGQLDLVRLAKDGLPAWSRRGKKWVAAFRLEILP